MYRPIGECDKLNYCNFHGRCVKNQNRFYCECRDEWSGEQCAAMPKTAEIVKKNLDKIQEPNKIERNVIESTTEQPITTTWVDPSDPYDIAGSRAKPFSTTSTPAILKTNAENSNGTSATIILALTTIGGILFVVFVACGAVILWRRFRQSEKNVSVPTRFLEYPVQRAVEEQPEEEEIAEEAEEEEEDVEYEEDEPEAEADEEMDKIAALLNYMRV